MNKKSIRIIVLIILILVVLGIGVFSYNKFLKNSSKINKNGEEKEVTYEGWIYTIPAGWKERSNFSEGGLSKLNIYNVDLGCAAIIRLIDTQGLIGDYDNVIQHYELLEAKLKAENMDVRNGKSVVYNSVPVIVFEYYFGENKAILAHTPAYDGYWYTVRFTSAVMIEGKERMYFDYKNLATVIDILANARKVGK